MISDANSESESSLVFSQPLGEGGGQFSAEILSETDGSDLGRVDDGRGNNRDIEDLSNSEDCDDEMEESDDEPAETVNLDPGGEWHPFQNKVTAQLVLLYHGSHRRNLDLVTFRAFMTILKV